jgi:sugar (pentulose or hexulose) kinase
MHGSRYYVIVLDIGKTNKKLFVYDDRLRCLNPDEPAVVFPQVERDGLLTDDMASIFDWMLTALGRAARRFKQVRCISISTHGATLALLGRGGHRVFRGDGGLVFPIVSYEQEISAEEDEAFYRDLGLTPTQMQERTGTPRFRWLLNHGKQVYWLRSRFPERFARVTDILMFPQYLSYLLTGKKAAEPTYLGCHGYLLDMGGRRYSIVARRLGLLDKLPPLPFRHPWEPLGTLKEEIAAKTGLPADCIVTVGVHDSNAALVPYFVKGFKQFVVQDSGTWVVTMSPSSEARFTKEELGKEVFFNRSIYGDPVKTTIFRGGAEFDFYRERVLPGSPHPADLDLELLREILAGRRAFSLPSVEPGSGLFPHSVARLEGVETIFRNPAMAWCVIDLGLAVQGYHAIGLAAGASPRQVGIEGNIGRNNPVYRSVISTLFPKARVSFSPRRTGGSTGAAAYGAAILGVVAAEGKRPEELGDRCRLDLQEVPKLDLDRAHLRRYVEAFLARVRSRSSRRA